MCRYRIHINKIQPDFCRNTETESWDSDGDHDTTNTTIIISNCIVILSQKSTKSSTS